MANGHWIVELIDRPWVDLAEAEKEAFDDWLLTAKGLTTASPTSSLLIDAYPTNDLG